MSPEIKPAATVMMIRERPGLEVLMVRRHHQIEFVGGALVFPGGKLDPEDRDPAWAALCLGQDGMSEDERALRVCAIREAYEESGILLARRETGDGGGLGAAAAERRALVEGGTEPFLDLVRGLGVRLDLPALTRFAHWITPAGMPKRFDTTFYLLPAPGDQVAACDGREAVDAEWIAPAEALAAAAAGRRTVVFPTRLNLGLLAESDGVASALAAARGRTIATVQPVMERRDGTVWVTIPADAGYGDVGTQAL